MGLAKKGGVPEFLFNCSYDVIKSFLDGFFAGDGYKKGQEIHINDTKLAKDLILLYTLIGVPTTYVEKENSQVIRLQHAQGRGSVNQSMVVDILYNRVPRYIVQHSKTQPFYDKTALVCKASIEKYSAHTDES
jgi:ribonucleoside-triphosphate reductase